MRRYNESMRVLLRVLLVLCLAGCATAALAQEIEDSARDLPTTGRIWSILENQYPWTVTEPMDAAGLETGTLPRFAAVGASWTENQFLLNGFDITDPYVPGQPLLDLHLDLLSPPSMDSLSKPATSAGSGTSVSLQPLPSQESTGGAASIIYSGGALQAFSPLSPQLDHIVDATFRLSGRVSGKVPFLAGGFVQDLSKTQDGFAAPIDGSNYGLLGRITPVANEQAQLSIFGAVQHLYNSREGADPLTAPEATTRATREAQVLQVYGRRESIEGGFAYIHARVDSAFQEEAQDSILQQPENLLSGSAPLADSGTRARVEAFLRARESYGKHAFVFEGRYSWNSAANAWSGRTQHILVDGSEAQTIRWNQDAETSVHFQNLAFAAQDQWKPRDWLSVPIGLRLGITRGGGISWTTLEPRLGLAIRSAPRGPSLSGSWSRYGHLMQGRYLDAGNPGAPSAGVYSGDTLISRSGGAYSALGAGLKQPVTDEVTAGMEQPVAGWRIGVTFFRRDDHNLIGFQNTGVPFDSYVQESVTDPGNDGIPGTADDGQVTLYNRDPETYGRDFYLLTNPAWLRNTCKGLRIYIEKPLSRKWGVSASFVAMKSSGTTSPGNSVLQNDVGIPGTLGSDPNTLVLSDSTTYFDRGFIGKLSAVYRWESGLHLGVIARYYDGLPFARMLFVQGFNQGPFLVRATPRDTFPDGFRTQFNATLDVRVSRAIGKWTILVDTFNLLNLNRKTRESDRTSPEFSTRVPILTQAPIAVRLGVERRF